MQSYCKMDEMINCYYIFVTPPLNTYRKRYGMDYLRVKGCEVKVIDVSPIVNPDAYHEVTADLITERIVLDSKRKYKMYMKKTSDDAVFFITTDFNFPSYFIHKAIRKRQKYGYLSRINTEFEFSAKPIRERVGGLLHDFNIKRVVNSLFIRIPKRWLHLQAADFVILGGNKNTELYLSISYIDEHTLIKHIHSADYETCLQALKQDEHLMVGKYCVFLDQYVPYHPDNISAGIIVNPEKYYRELEAFFQFIEEKYSVKVVIAVHPRADYAKHPDVLSKYQKIRFKTAELVRDSEFVIAHYSNSVSMAAIFEKPMILITTDDLNKYQVSVSAQKQIAELFGCSIYDISENIYENGLPEKIEIDTGKYEKFVYEYMCTQKGVLNKNVEAWEKQFYEIILSCKINQEHD